MHLGAISTVFVNRPLRKAARRMHELDLKAIEIGAGGFFPKTHCDPARLIADPAALDSFRATLAEFEMEISAIAMHGEPLSPNPVIAETYDREFRQACVLAQKLDVNRITLVAGLPEARPGDKAPNWILFSFPPRNLEMYTWQWEQRLIPYWKEHGKIAEDHGLRLCFEMHPGDMVYNPETLLRLRDSVGPVAGCLLDPSHLFWQGMDVIEVVRVLEGCIYHVHAKDLLVDRHVARVNGVLDPKDFFQLNKNRSWNFRTVGYGHSGKFWRTFISTLRLIGYDDVLSIETEDPLTEPEESLGLSAAFLSKILLRKAPVPLWFQASGRTANSEKG
jgi:sugar phosphate isomerase/epimerase